MAKPNNVKINVKNKIEDTKFCIVCQHKLHLLKEMPLLICTNDECSRYGVPQVVFAQARKVINVKKTKDSGIEGV